MPCLEAIVTEPEHNHDKYKLNPTRDPDSPTGVYIPVDIQDAIGELERMLHPALMEDIKNCENEIDLIGKHHFGLGMWMRNNWGLWHKSRLVQYLNSIGHYYFPDDASSFILKCFWKHLNGQPLDLDSR
jgi:hypothetical protein